MRHFGRTKLREQKLRGGLGGLRQGGYCAGMIEDAFLIEDYGCITLEAGSLLRLACPTSFAPYSARTSLLTMYYVQQCTSLPAQLAYGQAMINRSARRILNLGPLM